VPSASEPRHASGVVLVGPVSWSADAQIGFHDWVLAGRRIGLISRASPWWIGDWLLFGSARWGETYSVASRVTGYDPKSLRNMRYVASRFDSSLRKDKLTWSHHALLAGLEVCERRRWLERAVADRLSVEDLRTELRAARGWRIVASGAPQAAPATQAARRTVRCPNCGDRVPIPDAVLT
jgi:hypothetical protein